MHFRRSKSNQSIEQLQGLILPVNILLESYEFMTAINCKRTLSSKTRTHWMRRCISLIGWLNTLEFGYQTKLIPRNV